MKNYRKTGRTNQTNVDLDFRLRKEIDDEGLNEN